VRRQVHAGTSVERESVCVISGIPPSKTTLDSLLDARPGGHRRRSGEGGDPAEEERADDDGRRGINFTMFLTMMSERLFEFDTEAELVQAFECFDEEEDGTVRVEEMFRWLSEYGEKMDQREVSRFAP
jgi:myosin regulatory light chain 12